MYAEDKCPERHELKQKVVAAVQDSYAAKGGDRIAARAAERKAVKALEEHIKEHGCKKVA